MIFNNTYDREIIILVGGEILKKYRTSLDIWSQKNSKENLIKHKKVWAEMSTPFFIN
jgi:hypothetical protein